MILPVVDTMCPLLLVLEEPKGASGTNFHPLHWVARPRAYCPLTRCPPNTRSRVLTTRGTQALRVARERDPCKPELQSAQAPALRLQLQSAQAPAQRLQLQPEFNANMIRCRRYNNAQHSRANLLPAEEAVRVEESTR